MPNYTDAGYADGRKGKKNTHPDFPDYVQGYNNGYEMYKSEKTSFERMRKSDLYNPKHSFFK